MFNETHIGRRVICNTEGTGTITEFGFGSYPVGVKFDSLPDNSIAHIYYYADGRCCIMSDDINHNIRLLSIKVGSPDARKIVAMLAKEVRNYKHTKPEGYYLYTDENAYVGEANAWREAYNNAKQLLGEE